jgi:hypothetical protein
MRSFKLAFFSATLAVLAVAAQAQTTVVHPGEMHGWAFANENTSGGQHGGFTNGPGTPPLGSGSAYLKLTATNEGLVLGTYAHAGTPLAALTTLKYSTYRSTPGSGVQAPALQFNVDFDGSDTWQGRLVFEPYQTPGNTVVTGEWQEWDALAGRWWATRAPYNSQFGQSSPKTLQQILLLYPNARIRVSDGPILFKVGSGWLFEGAVDNFTIGVNGANTTYDFELEAPDADGDGVPDYLDHCVNSDTRQFVDTGNGNTSVANTRDANGCFLQDDVNEMQANSANHGQYVSAVTKWANALRASGAITQQQRNELVNGAARSNIGK